MINIRRRNQHADQQNGFTIVELMIATAVLSTVLLLATFIMISIGNLYYKGLSQSRVQDATRTITDQVSSQLQLTDKPAIGPVAGPNNTQAYCIGSVRYTFVLGIEIGHQSPDNPPVPPNPTYHHVLWRDNNPTPGSSCPLYLNAANPTGPQVDLTNANLATADPSGTELISANSRLTQFSISPVSPYTLSVAVAYGDDDLLCNPSVVIGGLGGTSSCKVPGTAGVMIHQNDYTGNDVRCKGGSGDRFCSTASLLNTTVVQRL